MPLRFLPEWLVNLAQLTPFPHLVNTVVEIYLGLLTGPDMGRALLLQAFWAALLIGAGQLILRLAVRRLVILGG
jgi:ABC-2 type transport system permease protein